jgi:hypothetical protein
MEKGQLVYPQFLLMAALWLSEQTAIGREIIQAGLASAVVVEFAVRAEVAIGSAG